MKLELEYAYWKSLFADLGKSKVDIRPYVPKYRHMPERVLPLVSAWQGIESILAEMIERFNIGTDRCLEFGVEFGYSTVALSSFFHTVVGVDTFLGDRHTTSNRDLYEETVSRLSSFDN